MTYLIFLAGLVSIVCGFFLIGCVSKNPIPKEEDTNMHNFQGLLSGLGLIAFGVVIIYRHL